MSDHLRGIADAQFASVGFLIFFVLFLIFLGLTWLPSQRKIHAHLERLPLEDNDKEIA